MALCVNQTQPHDIVGAIFVPRLMAGAKRPLDAKKATGGLDFVGKGEAGHWHPVLRAGSFTLAITGNYLGQKFF